MPIKTTEKEAKLSEFNDIVYDTLQQNPLNITRTKTKDSDEVAYRYSAQITLSATMNLTMAGITPEVTEALAFSGFIKHDSNLQILEPDAAKIAWFAMQNVHKQYNDDRVIKNSEVAINILKTMQSQKTK